MKPQPTSAPLALNLHRVAWLDTRGPWAPGAAAPPAQALRQQPLGPAVRQGPVQHTVPHHPRHAALLLTGLLAAGLLAAGAAQASPAAEGPASIRARVLSSTPVVAAVAVPEQVCADVQQVVQPRSSGMGALLGAIVGAAAGHGVGGGSGKALATGVGLVAGAAIGDTLESRTQLPQTQTVRQCQQQTRTENRVVGYNVVYEYAGQQYQTRMADKPGRTIDVDVNVTPAGATLPPAYEPAPAPAPTTYMAPAPVVAPVVVQPGYYYAPPAAVVVDYGPAPRPFHHRHHHRHWY